MPQTDTSPGDDCFSITPNDSADLAKPIRALVIANSGAVKVTKMDGTTDTLTLPAGVFPCRVRRVWSTGTTATGISGIA